MKKPLCLILLVAAFTAVGQPVPPAPQPTPPPNPRFRPPELGPVGVDSSQLTKFNLQFQGGTPKDLVAAIEKASERPLNVVIPEEYENERIPPLRMTQVTVAELFRAMELASFKTEPYRTSTYYGASGRPSYSYQQMTTSISFQTSPGELSDNSIWFFRGRAKVPDLSGWDAEPVPARTSRFYALAPYLEQGFKVEDITTAIQTGWRMLGEKEIPNISFHKETQLLIAVGEPDKLETVDSVLKALRPASQYESSGRRSTTSQQSSEPTSANATTPNRTATPESEP
jgi:hypothetical protein